MNDNVFFKVKDVNIDEKFKNIISNIADDLGKPIYLISQPLGANFEENHYEFNDGIVVLIPGYKILILNLDNDKASDFEYYSEDFIEDLALLSSKYKYNRKIGRPREWASQQIDIHNTFNMENLKSIVQNAELKEDKSKRISELLISLLTGSINDMNKIDLDEPYEILDKIKQKIVLFDGDQTKFIYKDLTSSEKDLFSIQGLSGTGKTELLLHKLKELYTKFSNSRIAFTCYSKVLAQSLKDRIPEFFNFMKVEEQIQWNERLFVFHSWGSLKYTQNIGFYSTICALYNLPFYSVRDKSFDDACQEAVFLLNSIENFQAYFDYVFVDESQDFPKSFFELCKKVTKKKVYAAGDIFQTIFDRESNADKSDLLLNKCYRTHPTTLMFSQAVGLGLLENPVINWLGEEGFKACGYTVQVNNSMYTLSRKNLRRFGSDSNLDTKFRPVFLHLVSESTVQTIINVMERIKEKNPTVKAKDIGIVFIDSRNQIYNQINNLKNVIWEKFNWESHIGYEDAYKKTNDKVFISNKNNIKGLEFPFLICVATDILPDDPYFRNTLYMALTRSYMSTDLIMSDNNKDLFDIWNKGLQHIYKYNNLYVRKPKENEVLINRKIQTYEDNPQSFEEIKEDLFNDYEIPEEDRQAFTTILESQRSLYGDFSKEEMDRIIKFHMDRHP